MSIDAVILTAGDNTIIITPREMHIALRDIIPEERGEAQRCLMLDGEIRLMKTPEGMRLVKRVASDVKDGAI